MEAVLLGVMNSHFPVKFAFVPKRCNIICYELINLPIRHDYCRIWSPDIDDLYIIFPVHITICFVLKK